ncbi:MAG: class I SAM-dependent methyltransferase [Chryseobacterium sp.]|nr:MAG: class I SAM-dependent methyltransferase [Chryseobacterium sp.]
MKPSEFWSQVANQYEEKFMNLNIYDDSYDLFCNNIKANFPSILEIGCGPANISKYISNKIPDAHIFGIDYSEKMIELAKKNVPNGKFEVMDCRDIDRFKDKFDAIISGFCLPYINEKELDKFISDINNLLKDNGLFYLSFVEGNPEDSKFQTSSTGHQLFFNFHLLEDIQLKLKRIGFADFQILKVNFERSETETEVHTIIIAGKLNT